MGGQVKIILGLKEAGCISMMADGNRKSTANEIQQKESEAIQF